MLAVVKAEVRPKPAARMPYSQGPKNLSLLILFRLDARPSLRRGVAESSALSSSLPAMTG